MNPSQILQHLPYERPFLFVDEITSISASSITGCYTFRKDEYFYRGHFKDNPITPGVILAETMAQIGLVAYGIYLAQNKWKAFPSIAFSDLNVSFSKPVLPGQKVWVTSDKVYFRLRKLKCKAKMTDEDGNLIAKGTMAGMVMPVI